MKVHVLKVRSFSSRPGVPDGILGIYKEKSGLDAAIEKHRKTWAAQPHHTVKDHDEGVRGFVLSLQLAPERRMSAVLAYFLYEEHEVV